MNRAYQELKQLLDDGSREEALHGFLFRHSFLLTRVGFGVKRIFSKPVFGSDFKADFALVGWGNYSVWTFVEIERSTHRLFTKNGLPTKALSTAIQQVNSWWIWMSDYGEYAGECYHELNGDKTACIVIGRRRSLSGIDSRLLQSFNQMQLAGKLRIVTWDFFLDELKQLQDQDVESAIEDCAELTKFRTPQEFSRYQRDLNRPT